MAVNLFNNNFSQLLVQFIKNSSIVTKVFCADILLCYLLGWYTDIRPYIAIVPGYLVPNYLRIWTLITFPYLEYSIISVIFALAVIFVICKFIEPLWGAQEVVIFYLLVNLFTGLWCILYYLTVYSFLGDLVYLYDVHIHGCVGYTSGVLVALKQLMPDQKVLQIPWTSKTLRIKDLPLLWLVATAVWSFVPNPFGAGAATEFAMSVCGTAVAWIYLRFFQSHQGSRGDMSEEFSLAHFLPRPVRPLAARPIDACYAGLLRVGVCRPRANLYDFSAPSGSRNALDKLQQLERKRHREIALKALNERLAELQEDKSEDWPDPDPSPNVPTESVPPKEPTTDSVSINIPATEN